MHATEILMTEHRAVLLALDLLERVGMALGETQPGAEDDLDGLLDFFRAFVDRCHHGKEEELLFPELVRRGLSNESGPVGVMLSEHELGRNYVRTLTEALGKIRAGQSQARSLVLPAIQSYRELLQAHIQKENHILFPMANCILPSEEDPRLVAAFDQIEKERLGEGRHEAYQHLLQRLQDRYLS